MNSSPNTYKERRELIDRLLNDEYALVHVSLHEDGVVAPTHLLRDKTATFKLSRMFRGAMALDEEEVVAELLFDNDYFECHFPYRAIWGATDTKGESVLWPDSAPPEVFQQILSSKQSKDAPKARRARADAKVAEVEPAPPMPQRGHLRRVK